MQNSQVFHSLDQGQSCMYSTFTFFKGFFTVSHPIVIKAWGNEKKRVITSSGINQSFLRNDIFIP